jgi:hypothetical protein
MYPKTKMVQRQREYLIREIAGPETLRTRIYRDGKWYRAVISDSDGWGWDGEGLTGDESLQYARERYEKNL